MQVKGKDPYLTRKATLRDVRNIHVLINTCAKSKVVLPRSLNFIYDNIRDFFICENRRGAVIGCCALHVVWQDLAEIKSLVVKKNYQGKNIGTMLVRRCLEEARQLGVRRVFALTYKPKFFRKNKFQRIRKSKLPAKVWR
ncbi:MAG: N-acetyltransferase, partial [Candidatus Omnitrophica bacterium]|nr:N-acetyltransferase [Candidatus Omnitrophota bacterium]